MTDHLSPEDRSALMRGVRRSGTTPELAVRLCLRKLKVRYRLAVPGLAGKPDIVLLSRRIAVFVHGCFWHRHPGCKRATSPKSRAEFWNAKLSRNVERDASNERALRAAGWQVVTIWECETVEPDLLVERLREAVGLGPRVEPAPASIPDGARAANIEVGEGPTGLPDP